MEKHKFAFADFVFDSRTGILTRKNRDLHLPEQSARLLAILLERANDLVMREELRYVLWPGEEYLDYDQRINAAINRLRNSIRDGGRNAQWIRTIPKRGYSFYGEVKRFGDSEPAVLISPAPAPKPPEFALQPATEIERIPPSILPVEIPGGSPIHTPWRRGWIAALVIAAIVTPLLTYRLHSLKAESRPLNLGIAPFQVHLDNSWNRDDALGENFRMELTEALSKLPGVQVQASSSFNSQHLQYVQALPQIATLDDLLIGSIVQQGTVLDLRFELVSTPDTVHLASFEYSSTKQDLPLIRDRLQQDIFYYLQSRSATIQATKGSTNDSRAYDLYLQGMSHLFDRNADSIKQSIGEFQQAISRDPSFASAFAGMATAYLKLTPYDQKSENVHLRNAQDYARRALKIDPQLAQAHAVLGYAAFAKDWDFVEGEKELRYAIRIDPAQADYRDWLSVLLVDQGRFDEGLQQLSLARTDDPLWPSVYAMESLMAGFARRDPEAITAGKTYVSLLPNLPIAHNTLAWVYFQSGQYQDAIAEWRQMALQQNDAVRVNLEDEGLKALKKGGIRAYAQLRLDAIRRNRGISQTNDFVPAEWYACAGKHDDAIRELANLVHSHDQYSLSIAVNPLFDSLHDDPQFQSLLGTIGLKLTNTGRSLNSHLCEAVV